MNQLLRPQLARLGWADTTQPSHRPAAQCRLAPAMDEWEERLNDNQLGAIAAEIEKLAGGLVDEEGIEPAHVDAARRSAEVANYVAKRLASAPPRLVTADQLATLHNLANAVKTSLQEFIDTKDAARIQTATQQVDQLLEHSAALPAWLPSEPEAMERFVGRLRQLEDETKRVVESAKADVGTERDRAIEAASKAASAATEAVTEVDRLRGELAAANEDVKKTLEEQKGRLDTLITSTTTDITNAQKGLRTEYSEWERGRRAEIDENLVQRGAAWDASQQERERRHDELIAYFESRKAMSDKILGTEAAAAVAGIYLEEAGSQRKQAYWWASGTVIVFLIAIGLSWLTIAEVTDSIAGLNNAQVAAVATVRTAFVAVLFASAAWMTSRVASHFEREREARQTGSELATFRPFLAELNLSDDKIQDLVSSRVDKYYPGQPNR